MNPFSVATPTNAIDIQKDILSISFLFTVISRLVKAFSK